MTQDQLEAEIKANRLCYIVVTDWNDNKLAVINEKILIAQTKCYQTGSLISPAIKDL